MNSLFNIIPKLTCLLLKKGLQGNIFNSSFRTQMNNINIVIKVTFFSVPKFGAMNDVFIGRIAHIWELYMIFILWRVQRLRRGGGVATWEPWRVRCLLAEVVKFQTEVAAFNLVSIILGLA